MKRPASEIEAYILSTFLACPPEAMVAAMSGYEGPLPAPASLARRVNAQVCRAAGVTTATVGSEACVRVNAFRKSMGWRVTWTRADLREFIERTIKECAA